MTIKSCWSVPADDELRAPLLLLEAVRLLSQAVEELYAQGLELFPTSALLNVFVAGYVQHYRSNRHVEYLHLKAAAVSVLFLKLPTCPVTLVSRLFVCLL
jgi:hypothetical protein